jgi:hypothetical protein
MADEPRPTEQATVPETFDDDWGGLVTPEMGRQNPVWRFLEDNYPRLYTGTDLVEHAIDDEAAIRAVPTGPKTLLIDSLRAFEKNTGAGTRALNLLSQQADKHGVSLEGRIHKFEKEGLSKADLLKFYQKAGWELRYPDEVERSLSEGKAIEDIRVEMIRAPRPTDLVPVATDLVPLAVPPKEDPSQKKPKQTGKIWRGIGSMMRRRLVPIAQAAQLGWSALSDEQKGQVTEFLNNPIDFGLGRSEHPPGFKGGLDYFRQMLGMGPEQGGIASLPDLREPAPVYYSAVARAVDALPMERGAGEQMLAMISKSKGIKPEEMQWMDLPEFLRDKKSVTKQEIQDFVGANQLDIKEVVRSEDALTDADALQRIRLTLPGGENYREVAFTLPGIASAGFPEFYIKYYGVLRPLDASTFDEAVAEARLMGEVGRDSSRVVFRGYNRPGVDLTGGHLKIPNTLAHVRLKDRTGPNGEKILFVEEMQSDWHARGREYGYQDSPQFFGRPSVPELESDSGPFWDVEDETGKFVTEVVEFDDRVPDAPLKKTWYEMVFRRIARMAAEGGYDSVAWTPGEIQAERYDLSRQISEIHLSGTNFKAYDLDGRTVIEQTGVKADDLPELIGKEAADRLLAQKPERGLRSLTGEDLKLGGEKLKGLYDGRIKNYASDFGKKFGARVGTTEINPYDDGAISGERIMERLGIPGSDWHEHWRNLTQDRRDELIEQYRRRFEGTKVWNLPITPEMKEELLTQGIQKIAHGGFIDKPFYDRAV